MGSVADADVPAHGSAVVIAIASSTRRPRLLPICRVRYCRSVATETLIPGAAPFWCQRCLARMLALKPEAKL